MIPDPAERMDAVFRFTRATVLRSINAFVVLMALSVVASLTNHPDAAVTLAVFAGIAITVVAAGVVVSLTRFKEYMR